MAHILPLEKWKETLTSHLIAGSFVSEKGQTMRVQRTAGPESEIKRGATNYKGTEPPASLKINPDELLFNFSRIYNDQAIIRDENELKSSAPSLLPPK